MNVRVFILLNYWIEIGYRKIEIRKRKLKIVVDTIKYVSSCQKSTQCAR